MKHIALTPFGRGPATLAQVATARSVSPCPVVDKWQAFAYARTARARLGLTDRDLAVLHALLSFLPVRELKDGAPLVVFPSNATLSDRAHGMAESTLRRHIAALVAAGLVARRDSPNGKRFATRTRSGDIAQAYGLDLRPLLQSLTHLEMAAHAAEEEAQALAEKRARVVVMLRDAAKLAALARQMDLLESVDPEPVLHLVRQGLRRTTTSDRLTILEKMLDDALTVIQSRLDASIMSGDDAHIERHIQDSDLKNHESKGDRDNGGEPDAALTRAMPDVPLALVLKACPGMQAYHEGPWNGWSDLERAANRVAPWLGIDGVTWERARLRMGAATAAATVAAMVERCSTIRNPGGYLRSLTDRFESGRFTLGPMIVALLSPVTS